MSIPTIEIEEVSVQEVYVPNWIQQQPTVDYLVPPVILNIGNPIVNMPGCVKSHRDNQYHKSGLPLDKNLVEQDPDKAMILCDAQVPSYDAMNYEPEQLIITRAAPIPDVRPPETPPTPDVPNTGDLSPNEEVPCPGPNQPRVGDLTQKGDEKVIGHELSADGKTCVVLYENTTTAEKFLPSTNQVSTTAAIAVVATAAAAATPLLLRVIKPIIKKTVDTIRKKFGKTPYRLSRDEIKANQYRQSKGLNPLNFEKMKKKG